MLLGTALALWWLRGSTTRAWLTGPVPKPLRGLVTLGRWSLLYYLLHQPVLIGALTVWQWVWRWM
jgi:uncharacterized membrane protein